MWQYRQTLSAAKFREKIELGFMCAYNSLAVLHFQVYLPNLFMHLELTCMLYHGLYFNIQVLWCFLFSSTVQQYSVQYNIHAYLDKLAIEVSESYPTGNCKCMKGLTWCTHDLLVQEPLTGAEISCSEWCLIKST